MKIFDKIKVENEVQKFVYDGYKHEMKLAISVLIVILFGDILVTLLPSTHSISSFWLSLCISLQVLVFIKYLYDRRIKLQKDIKTFS